MKEPYLKRTPQSLDDLPKILHEPTEFEKEQLKHLKTILVCVQWMLGIIIAGVFVSIVVYMKMAGLFV